MRHVAIAAVAAVVAFGPGTGQGQTVLSGHGGPIMGIDVALDGTVVTASFDNAVGVWTDGDPIWLDGHDAAVTAVAALSDGRIASGGDDFAVRLWTDGRSVELGRHAGKVAALAASPDGALLASAGWDGTIGLWSLADAAPRRIELGDGGVNDVAFAPGGDVLYAATQGGTLWRLDPTGTAAGRPLVRHGFGINRVAVGAGWLAYGAVDGVTRVVDPENGGAIHDVTLERRPILAMAHHDGTRRLAVGDGDGYVMVLDTRDWSLVRDFRATLDGPVWALAYGPDGATLYAGGLDDAAHAWPVGTDDAELGAAGPAIDGRRAFLRDPATMSNGQRQFTRKCAICHDLDAGPSRRAGPSLHGLFGRRAGTVEGYAYSPALARSAIVWDDDTIDALFDQGPAHYVPGTKMPMQVIAGATDRADLIEYLRNATRVAEERK